MLRLALILLLPILAFGQTIQEKKMRSAKSGVVDQEARLTHINSRLQEAMGQRRALFARAEGEGNFEELFEEKRLLSAEISSLQEEIRALKESSPETSLWHYPVATFGQLVSDYSQNYLYILTKEASDLPIAVSSHLPITNGCWDDLIEQLAQSMGLSVTSVNGFVKRIAGNKETVHGQWLLTQDAKQLSAIDPSRNCLLILDAPGDDGVAACTLLSKLCSPEQVKIFSFSGRILLRGPAAQVHQLAELWTQLGSQATAHSWSLILLERIAPQDAERALTSFFRKRPQKDVNCYSDFHAVPIASNPPALFVTGSQNDVRMSEEILRHMQSQTFDPKEKTLFCYVCKHTKAEEIAKVLRQVWTLLQQTPSKGKGSKRTSSVNVIQQENEDCCDETNVPDLIVNPGMINPGASAKNNAHPGENFIVDAQSGSIICVIEKERVQEIAQLLNRLDSPKKMVRIEVLLFEKRMTSEDRIGLNLLKVGSQASGSSSGGFSWNADNKGILSYFISHAAGGGLPAFDLIYSFMLSQEDVQINACPSVTTINQTPAKIALVEEISLNNGAILLESGPIPAPFVKESYSRAQYGITIGITPTIHAEECGPRTITLETDITFDTAKPSKDSRPDVTRRNIKNQVRIADGETVVIGGLRRKTNDDQTTAIPFFGEIPVLGRLFSDNTMRDSQTEMFIFLTPHVLDDNVCENRRATLAELQKRPGDVPALICCLIKAKENQRRQLFEGSVKLAFGNDVPCN